MDDDKSLVNVPLGLQPDAVLNQEEVRKKVGDAPDLEDWADYFGVFPDVIEDIMANKLAPYPEVAILTVRLAIPPRFVGILQRFCGFMKTSLAEICRSELIATLQTSYREILNLVGEYPGLADDADYLEDLHALEGDILNSETQIMLPANLVKTVHEIQERESGPISAQDAVIRAIQECLKKERGEESQLAKESPR